MKPIKWKRPSKKMLKKTPSKIDIIRRHVEPEDEEEAYANSIGW